MDLGGGPGGPAFFSDLCRFPHIVVNGCATFCDFQNCIPQEPVIVFPGFLPIRQADTEGDQR